MGYLKVNGSRTLGELLSADIGRLACVAQGSNRNAASAAWSVDALVHLDAMDEFGELLEILTLEGGTPTPSNLKEASSTLAKASEEALRWLDGTPAPESGESGAAEMRAAAGVYRNAAWMARRR